MTADPTAEHHGALAGTVLEFDRIVSRLVPEAKRAEFAATDWAPLVELIAVDEFERVGIWREAMNWEQYTAFLTKWAASKDFETVLRRISEVPPLVYFEVEEHHINGDAITIVNSMSVFEFNDAGKIRHLDVYLQGELYAAGKLPDYAVD
jgi:hypothetical protein